MKYCATTNDVSHPTAGGLKLLTNMMMKSHKASNDVICDTVSSLTLIWFNCEAAV